jgi:hypothetical protein
MNCRTLRIVGVVAGWLSAASLLAAEPTAAERGKKALLEHCYSPPTITRHGFDNLWKQWGLEAKPSQAEFDRILRERYGLHDTTYPNDGLPMGLREAPLTFGLGKGISLDCMLCHGGSIAGKSYVGLGNTALELQGFFEETGAADGHGRKTPFHFSNTRGTNEASAVAVFLLSYRDSELKFHLTRVVDVELHDDLCEDVPAWWLLKKKKTMYRLGATDARSVRSNMQFMMNPLNGPDDFAKAEAAFKDIREYILSLEPPKYPLPINRDLVVKGETLFVQTCARCHGTYGAKWTYPNRVVPIEEIGTDRTRFDGISRKLGEHYNNTWFAKEEAGWLGDGYKVKESKGYQAPPLDGIWATAPYLHNGSVPTLYHMLNSKARPKIFTRSFRTDLEAYDAEKVGWKVEVLDKAPDATKMTPIEFRKIYDTSKPGRGNGGHTYGDKFTDAERMAVIEYLKTL